MQVKEITVYEVSYKFGAMGNTRTLKVGSKFIFIYSPISMKNYSLEITHNNSGFKANFGCFHFTKTDLEEAISQLDGKPITIKVKYLKNKKTNRNSKATIVDTTNDYFISKSMKAYPKSEWELQVKEMEKKPLQFRNGWDHGIYFKGRLVYNNINDDGKTKIREVMMYILDCLNGFEEQYKSLRRDEKKKAKKED